MYEGEAWHGPSVMDALRGITADQARLRPVPNAHSIYELTHHMAAWIGEARSRLLGSRAKEPSEGDFPRKTATVDEASWRAVRDRLAAAHTALLDDLSRFDAGRLDERLDPSLPDAGGRVTSYILLQGVAQHNAYHAGQILVLRRAMGA